MFLAEVEPEQGVVIKKALLEELEVEMKPLAETSGSRKAPSIQLEVKKLSSFKISKSKYQISLMQKDGMCKFRFRRGTVDYFVGQLKCLVPTTQ